MLEDFKFLIKGVEFLLALLLELQIVVCISLLPNFLFFMSISSLLYSSVHAFWVFSYGNLGLQDFEI